MPSVLQHAAAALFSTAVFRPLLAGEGNLRAVRATSRIRHGLSLPNSSTNSDVVATAYDYLRTSYRSEYYYRNLLVSKLFVGRHRASRAVLLNEFHVGTSVADCVLVNGRGLVYEIKTEYDSPDKLAGQVANYHRAFPLVNVVTHVSQASKYERLLEGTPVGLYAVGRRGALSCVKETEAFYDRLDVKTMFNTLRQSEITSILRRYHGETPVVPNGIRYATQLSLARQIPPMEFQQDMLTVLKGRELAHSRDLVLRRELAPLRALLVQLDPDQYGRANLVRWLKDEEN